MERPRSKADHDEDSGPRSSQEGPATSPWTRHRSRQAHRIGANRLGNVLNPVSPQRAVIEIELVPDLIINGLRYADGARLGERLEAGGDINAVAKDVVTVDDHIAEVDANPQLETALGRDRVVDGARGALHFHGAFQRIDDARKIRQQAVTGRADDPSAVRSDQRVDGAAQFTQGLVGTRLVFAHQPAETGYIRVQNCGELPLPRSSYFRRTRRVIEQGSHRGCV